MPSTGTGGAKPPGRQMASKHGGANTVLRTVSRASRFEVLGPLDTSTGQQPGKSSNFTSYYSPAIEVTESELNRVTQKVQALLTQYVMLDYT